MTTLASMTAILDSLSMLRPVLATLGAAGIVRALVWVGRMMLVSDN